jgi:FtsP/CotA-like multicopper oxidase with cupredoxin domain
MLPSMRFIAMAYSPPRREAVFCLLLGLASAAIAAESLPFDPRSTGAAPCGTGIPPPGHEVREIRAPPEGITLIVRQDGNRLCYVSDDNADAPIIRVGLGDPLTITLRNEISQIEAIASISGPSKLTSSNEPVPRRPGFYEVVPGMRHPATGATNLHLHGFAVPPVQPQDEVLKTCTDPADGPALCGQRSITYRYQVPLNMTEGLYWYHPHVHGEVQAQMLMGLSGAIIVEGPREAAWQRAGIRERVLIVRQTQDLDAGRPQAAAMTAAPTTPPEPSTRMKHAPNAVDTADELLCTRNAGIDAISLNGTPIPLGDVPDAALAHWQLPENQTEFWRILNAATDAFLDLSLIDEHGAALPIEVVATDGSALSEDSGTLLPPEKTTESQFVPPGGRLEILIHPPPRGTKAYLVTHAVDTGCAGDRLPERRLAVIEASPATTAPAVPIEPARPANMFRGLIARRTDHRRVIALAEYPRPGSDDQVDFYIAERRPGAVLKPYMMGDRPAITVRAGTTEEWVIENWTNELHAFHIHQVHFRVLDVNGEPMLHPALLDVVNVPYASATGYHSKEGPIRPGRVRIKLNFPRELAGDIPFHCHLVDHEDNGMMAVLRVLPVH